MTEPVTPLPTAPSATDEELAAFVGPRADYYLAHWKNTASWGFNWAACVCGLFWLAYRKLNRELAIIFTISVVLSAIVTGIARLGFGLDAAPDWVSMVISLALGIAVGQAANYWYFRHAQRVIAKLKLDGGEEWRAKLPLAGGTSMFSVLAWAVILLGLFSLIADLGGKGAKP